jgi:GDP-4-dehydro-6-deoxy-D-mannose reductase
MRIAVTGAGGFVGRWLAAELRDAGHEVIAATARDPDVTDRPAVERWIAEAAPAAVVHLAAVSSGRAAAADPIRALEVNVGGTIHLIDAAGRLATPPIVLVASSAEAYGHPARDELPLGESSPLRPRGPYALTKVAQESAAIALGARARVPILVTRAFNHTGPGQSTEFVVPAIAARVVAVARSEASDIPIGNLDVARDLLDVRDVARAYRLLLEGAAAGTVTDGTIVNVSSGRSVTVREILSRLCAAAGVDAPTVVDPALVRPGEALEVRGDPTRIAELVGWRPTIDLERTLTDVLDAARSGSAGG